MLGHWDGLSSAARASAIHPVGVREGRRDAPTTAGEIAGFSASLRKYRMGWVAP